MMRYMFDRQKLRIISEAQYQRRSNIVRGLRRVEHQKVVVAIRAASDAGFMSLGSALLSLRCDFHDRTRQI